MEDDGQGGPEGEPQMVLLPLGLGRKSGWVPRQGEIAAAGWGGSSCLGHPSLESREF